MLVIVIEEFIFAIVIITNQEEFLKWEANDIAMTNCPK